ncbi:unnamed protein product [Cuscuta epithymum]|uniref:RNase H type-1 domain-containing protein n=1 Tax=Cuscuta epithymum TaxID=186058 RepID=A0AAV0DEX3_9ASTE|nr:unnamed protein product [Cuscuta epithymum]
MQNKPVLTVFTPASRKYLTDANDDLIQEGILPVSIHRSRTKILIWKKTYPYKLRLSVDAAFREGRGAGGAVLRDDGGKIIAGFFMPLRVKTVLQAEVQVALRALEWCARSGFLDFQLESDSEMTMKLLQKKSRPPIYLQRTVDEAHRLCRTLHVRTQHIFREMNLLSHALAQLGLNSDISNCFNTSTSLPNNICTIIDLDINGIPSFRK